MRNQLYLCLVTGTYYLFGPFEKLCFPIARLSKSVCGTGKCMRLLCCVPITGQGFQHRPGVPVHDVQKYQGWALWASIPLLPMTQRANGKTKQRAELPLTHSDLLSNSPHIHRARFMYDYPICPAGGMIDGFKQSCMYLVKCSTHLFSSNNSPTVLLIWPVSVFPAGRCLLSRSCRTQK